MRTPYLLGLLVFAIVLGCSRASESRSHSGAARAASERYRTALNTADTATFFGLLQEDLELFPPASTPLRGAAAHDVFRGLFTNFVATLEPLEPGRVAG